MFGIFVPPSTFSRPPRVAPGASSDNTAQSPSIDQPSVLMFSGASHTLVSGGTFTSVTNTQLYHENGIKLLREKVASGAFHDSAERYDPPKCHPGTRKVIINEIMDWIETTNKEEFFLWLYGPAGAGKSAIAQSIAELCCKARFLAASFFFSRTAAGRNDASLLIPTLAYQLTVSVPDIIKHISMAVEKDTLIFTRSLEAQLEVLIIEPLSKLIHFESDGKSNACPKLIIIDGLDECGQPKTQRYILTTLLSAVQRYHIPLFFLIASRPEQEIRNVFNSSTMTSLTRRLVLDDTYEPDADIKIFLASKFAKIKEDHPLSAHISPSWPSDFDLDHLIRKASGQFIYASTVIKFVESTRHRPTDRLDIVFGLKTPGKQTPFTELDALYTLIFMSVEDIEMVLDIFMFLLLFGGTNDKTETSSVIEAFWGHQPGELQIILADLHSVVSVPLPQSKEQKLQLFHASLGDFLMDKSRSGQFFIDAPRAHARMAEYCIKHTSTFMSLGEMGNEDHLKVSCRMLMNECLNAYPAKELLEALESFRFDTFLALPSIYKGSTSWRQILADLPKLLHWIRQQCLQTHSQNQKCLCRRYMAHIDYHLQAKLSNYPLSDPRCQYLFTAFTLASSGCAFETSGFLHIIQSNKVPTLENIDQSRMRLIDLMNSSDDYPNLRSMLSAFLTNHARSGSYYRDRAKYIDLAMKCVDYLCIPASPFQVKLSSIEECASMITLDILSHYPRDHKLVKFLRLKLIRMVAHPRNTTISAIKAYIKDYDLNTASASLSEQDLSRTTSSTSTEVRRAFTM